MIFILLLRKHCNIKLYSLQKIGSLNWNQHVREKITKFIFSQSKKQVYMRINKSKIYIATQLFYNLKWLLGFKKLKSTKKVEILLVALVLRVASWKNFFFFHGEKRWRFFLIFNMKLSSAGLSYLSAHSISNFAITFLNISTIQTSKEQVWIL